MPIIENLAEVTARQGDQLCLKTTSPTGCARCDRGEGCGGGVFGKLIQRRLSGLQLTDPGLDLQPGQIVVLGLESSDFLKVTMLTYIAPLLVMLMAAGGAHSLGASDGLVAICGIAGLVIAALILPGIRRYVFESGLQPHILRRAGFSDLKACE